MINNLKILSFLTLLASPAFSYISAPTAMDDFNKWATGNLTQAQQDHEDMTKFMETGDYKVFRTRGIATAVKAACDTNCNRMTCGNAKYWQWCEKNCGGGNHRLILSCEGQHGAALKKQQLKGQ
jgi:hypothetical protein